MLKSIKNLASLPNDPKISIQSKGIVNTGSNWAFYASDDPQNVGKKYYSVDSDRVLFIKISFSGLTTNDRIAQTLLSLIALSVPCNLTVKLYSTSLTDFPSTAEALYSALDASSGNLIEQVALTSVANYNDGTIQTEVAFDLSEIVSQSNSANPSLIVAVLTDNASTNPLSLFDPEDMATSVVVAQALTIDNRGLNSLSRFDEYSCSSSDKGYVNVESGELVHVFSLFASTGPRMPISLSLAHAEQREHDGTLLPGKLKLNFEYRIYMENGLYIVEDYTGSRRSYVSPSLSESLESLGAHSEAGGSLYYCYEDCSYMNVFSGPSGGKMINLYDQRGNFFQFAVKDDNTQLVWIKNSCGEQIILEWTAITATVNHLLNATNSSGDSVTFSYSSSSPYYLQEISFVGEKRKICFSDPSGFSFSLYDTESSDVLIKRFDVGLNGNAIASVQEKNAESLGMKKLLYSYSDGKIASVSLFDYDENLLGTTSYQYGDGFTKAIDYAGNPLYSYFDSYGRTRTILDKNGRAMSMNYDEIVNGLAQGPLSESKPQSCARNLLENHSFERLDNNGKLIGWTKTGNGTFTLSDDSLFGEKCLHISSSLSLAFHQSIPEPPPLGSYRLKIRAKGAATSNVIVRATLSYTTKELVFPSGPGRPYFEDVWHDVDYDISGSSFSSNWETYQTSLIFVDQFMGSPVIAVKIVSTGTADVYLDDFQFATADQNVRYNLIENGYLEKKGSNNLPTGWSFVARNSADKLIAVSSTDEHLPILGNYAMRFAPCEVSRVSNCFTTRIMQKEVDVSGRKNDEFCFGVWAKCYASANTKLKAFVSFYYDNLGTKTYSFDFDKNVSSWQFLSRSIVAEDDYDSIFVGVEYDGPREALFDAFQLCKDTYGRYYAYDRWGNLIETSSSNGASSKICYQDGKPSSFLSEDGSYYRYEYSSAGRLLKVSDASGASVLFQYGPNNSLDHVTQTTIQYQNETIVNSYQYDANDNLIQSVDAFNNATTMTYDGLRRVLSETRPNGSIQRYEYDNLSNLLSISGFLDSLANTPSHENEMDYDYRLGAQTMVRSTGGLEYAFLHDEAGRLTAVQCDNQTVEQFSYEEFANGVNRNLISSKRYGTNGDLFEFEYDAKGRLIHVDLNSARIFEYEYNEDSKVSAIKDLRNSNIKYYSYDQKGNLIKLTNGGTSIEYRYDNLGSVQEKVIRSAGGTTIERYDYDYEFNGCSKEGFLSRLGGNYGDEVVLSDREGLGEYGLRYADRSFERIDDVAMESKLIRFSDQRHFIWYNLDSANSCRSSALMNGQLFNRKAWWLKFNYQKIVYLWFKPTSISSGPINILRLLNSRWENPVLGRVDIRADGKVEYKDHDGLAKVATSSSVANGQWNFLCVTITRSNSSNQIALHLNGNSTSSVSIAGNPYLIDRLLISYQDLNPVLSPQSTSSNLIYDYSMTSTLDVSLLGISNRVYSSEELREMNAAWHKYFPSPSNSSLKVNSVSYFNTVNCGGMDVIPLNGDTDSLNGLKPIVDVKKRITFDKEFETPFLFNSACMRWVYSSFSSDGHGILRYAFPLTQTGTISLWFMVEDELAQYRYILSFFNGSAEQLSIRLEGYNDCCLRINGNSTPIQLGSSISVNVWHHLYLCFENGSGTAYFDGYSHSISSVNLSNCVGVVGNAAVKSDALEGFIENVCFSPELVPFDMQYKANGRFTTIADTLDGLGRTIARNHVIGSAKHTTTYTYNGLRLSGENVLGEQAISYSYDSMGNITGAAYPDRTETYGYDAFGRLASRSHTGGAYQESYTYDSAGNILSSSITGKGSYSFAYTGGRLTSVLENNIAVRSISYDADRHLYPSAMTIGGTSKTMTWSGDRLLAIGSDIEYRYNEDGVRIYKHTLTEETTYEVEGIKVLAMNKTTGGNTYRFEFRYDQNGIVSGLAYNGNEYVYVKDALGTILGIVSADGTWIARYAHTAYGEPSDSALAPSGDALAVASHSPFRFKGYLFDGETGLYYLNARYYDPSSGRFASPDGFAYLDPWALGFGPNPYAYCGCSPLLFADWEGNDAIAATVGAALLFLIAIGALVVITIETQTHFLTNATAAFADAVCEIAEFYAGQNIPLVFGSVSLVTFPTANEPFAASVEDSAVINVEQLTFSFSIQDPFARPGQKKQGRELKSKGRARFRDRIKFRRGRKPPKHHTPGRDHKKYVLAFLIQRLIDSDHRRRDDARFF